MLTTNLEVCCADVESLLAAREGGADRIELCSALSEGGLTPSPGLIRFALSLGFSEVKVLIRSRKGDFFYSPHDMKVMMDDAEMAVKAGATGIVWGALTPDGNIDTRLLKIMWDLSLEAFDFTFHRAFDLCADPMRALDEIMDSGCTGLLTSGLAPTAMQGAEMIAELKRRSNWRIDIIAASGVNSQNCRDLILRTGVFSIHSSARRPQPSRMKFRRPDVAMGAPGEDEYSRLVTSADEVSAILEAIDFPHPTQLIIPPEVN